MESEAVCPSCSAEFPLYPPVLRSQYLCPLCVDEEAAA